MLKCSKCDILLLNSCEIPSILSRYLATFSSNSPPENLFLCNDCYTNKPLGRLFSLGNQYGIISHLPPEGGRRRALNDNHLLKPIVFNKQINLECCDCSNTIHNFYICLPDNYLKNSSAINIIKLKNVKGKTCNECTERNLKITNNNTKNNIDSQELFIRAYYKLKVEERKMVENLIASVCTPENTNFKPKL
jgi:hypothetical protein